MVCIVIVVISVSVCMFCFYKDKYVSVHGFNNSAILLSIFLFPIEDAGSIRFLLIDF